MDTADNTLPPLWSHQERALRDAGNRHALFFDPGCGKTRTTIELFKRAVAQAGRPMRMVVFAPLNVVRNWEKELHKYLDQEATLFVVAGQLRKKKKSILAAYREFNSTTEHAILIANIELLRNADYRISLYGSRAEFLVVDESHNFKSSTSAQTKGLLELEAKLQPSHLYLLSGTPSPQGYIDLWSTFALLKKTNMNFFVWRKKYFHDRNERRRGTQHYWPDYQITERGQKEIEFLLRECSTTARKDLVLDLPPLLRTTRYAEMGPEQKQHYESMKEFLFAIDEEGNELNAANVLSRTLRLQQILAGHIGEIPVKENPRLETLLDCVTSIKGEQFIVWTIFKATYQEIAKVLDDAGVSYGMLTGEQTVEERQTAMDAFQAGTLRALIAHPKAGGVGVNLTAASYSIHYTRSFSLTDDMQAEARNYRGGSEIHKRITRIDIVTPGTIDEDITEALRQKKTVQEFILGVKERKNGKR